MTAAQPAGGWHSDRAGEHVLVIRPGGSAALGRDAATVALRRVLERQRDHRAVVAWDIQEWPPVGSALRCHRMPVIGVVTGPVAAPGLSCMVDADLRVAAADATVTVAQPDGALVTEPATIAGLSRLIGPGTAGYWLLTRGEIAAEQAVADGLFDAVHPPARLQAAVLELATGIAEAAPLALEYAKRCLWRGTRLDLAAALDLESDLYAILQTTADRDEGVRAFLQRRAPDFAGR
jgi:enoyl-CoA hydratase/carnithine racemase